MMSSLAEWNALLSEQSLPSSESLLQQQLRANCTNLSIDNDAGVRLIES
jgi:hypothetical protein